VLNGVAGFAQPTGHIVGGLNIVFNQKNIQAGSRKTMAFTRADYALCL
jgi:hypothetical protein